MTRGQTGQLQPVGFWCDPAGARMRPIHGPADPYVLFLRNQLDAEARSGRPFLPDPDRILQILGSTRYEERVPRYLESGQEFAAYLGYATCRCCGLSGPPMGSRDLTDGMWVWPEGLSHYLRAHCLPLPEAFLRTMAEHRYRVPRLRSTGLQASGASERDPNYWYRWSADVYNRGAAG